MRCIPMSKELVFKRQQLFEQIGMNLEDVKLIMKYQKELPILCSDENEINARKLHNQLGVGKAFSTWIKSMIERGGFIKDEDYRTEFIIPSTVSFKGSLDNQHIESMSPNERGRIGISEEYYISIDMAKEISMLAGLGNNSSKELKEKSKLARKYFIVCEKALKLIAEWNRIREPEKNLYKEMCSELNKYTKRNFNKECKNFDYMNEANMLNKICLGANAKDIREYIDAQDKNTRDYLNKKYNEYLYKMQELDILYLRMNYSKEVRSDIIQKAFNVTYPDASFFMCDKEVKRIIKNKKQYVKDQYNK